MATSTKTAAKTTADAVETKTAAKKTTKTKASETKTTAAKKTTKKAATVNPTYILQFSGKEFNAADIYENVKNAWVAQSQGKIEDIKSVEIYLKPEENRAYYVINGESKENYSIEL